VVNNDRIRDKLQSIKENVIELEHVSQIPQDEFLGNTILFHAATRMLQISIEAVLDIAQHIVARKHLGTPKSYRDAIELLANEGILTKDQLPNLYKMTKFRNRVVHLYDEVSREEVYRIIRHHLSDFDGFIASIVQYVWGQGL